MSKWLIFVEKLRKLLENKWINDFIKFVSLLQIIVWTFKVVSEFIKFGKKFAKKVLFKVKKVWDIARQSVSKEWNKAKTKAIDCIEELKEELKNHRGGDLNKSVLLYQVGSLKYGYEKLDESRQNDIYWINRARQADEWTNRQIIREKLVSQVSHDFNLKRDGEKIKKYFRPTWELKSKLKWIDEEIKNIMLKNPLRDRSKKEQKRLDELFVDKKRLEVELYYSKKFFIIY